MIIINNIILNQKMQNQKIQNPNTIMEELNQFFSRLQKEGWGVVTQVDVLNIDSEPTLMITNSVINAEKAKSAGIPCVFYDTAGNATGIYGVDMVVEGLEEIDSAFLIGIYNRHYKIPSVIAGTSRLIIRETVPDDTDALYEIYKDQEIVRFLTPLAEDVNEQREILDSYFTYMYGLYGYGMWTVVEKSSGQMIGRVGFENGELEGAGIVELGYLIGTAWRKQGYAYEAVSAVLEYGKNVLGFGEVYIRTKSENLVSCALAGKAGFQLIKDGDIQYYKRGL
ncbi:MAG: GNAT family N-acetyltransferase [Clostridiales bacterium]|nr:GNAT family N-acetyltransferase [Clostridiales bacterium]MDU3243324.1 GNAT family N-acetyltransferase [Clostridiales bacterium]